VLISKDKAHIVKEEPAQVTERDSHVPVETTTPHTHTKPLHRSTGGLSVLIEGEIK